MQEVFVPLNNIKKYLLAAVLMLAAIAIYQYLKTPSLYSQKTLRFTYTLKNTSNDLISSAEVTSLLPADIEGYQKVLSISSSEQYELIGKGAQNQSIKFKVKDFPPFATRVINLTLQIKLAHSAKQKRDGWGSYLSSEPFIEKDSTAVKNLAQSLSSTKTGQYAKSVYEWLVNNIKNLEYIADNKGAQYAIEKHMGDCTEHAFAFAALMRAKNIPARALAGFYVPQDAALLNSVDYHNWAEFYDGEWVISDSQKQIFAEQYQNYVIVRILGQENTDKSARFMATDPRISISL